jgi:hypothetical protein
MPIWPPLTPNGESTKVAEMQKWVLAIPCCYLLVPSVASNW